MMRKYITAIITFLSLTTFCTAQQNNWDRWNSFLGQWQGEGSGQTGQGGGTFSFTFDLDKKIIVRKSHSEYPATENKPKIIHDDLMIIYLDFSGNPSKAIYFDSEGHTINYTISYEDNKITFISDKISNVPLFRLTYTLLSNNTVDTKFEISQDGEKFITYVEGKKNQ
jgi:hypothetical protein